MPVMTTPSLQIALTEAPAPVESGWTQMAPARTRKRVRSDALPEYSRYRDDGCDVSSTCLTCPLPRCRYEEPGGLRAILNELRDRQIVLLRKKGVSVDELAGQFGISRRTIFRVLGSYKASRQGATVTPIRAPIESGRTPLAEPPGRPDENGAESRCA
jgi:hypothetical protein